MSASLFLAILSATLIIHTTLTLTKRCSARYARARAEHDNSSKDLEKSLAGEGQDPSGDPLLPFYSGFCLSYTPCAQPYPTTRTRTASPLTLASRSLTSLARRSSYAHETRALRMKTNSFLVPTVVNLAAFAVIGLSMVFTTALESSSFFLDVNLLPLAQASLESCTFIWIQKR